MKVILTDSEIEEAFSNTDFGTRDFRRLLEQGVLKSQAGYRSGHTLTEIMKSLGLIGKNDKVLKKGRGLIFEAFYDSKNTG